MSKEALQPYFDAVKVPTPEEIAEQEEWIRHEVERVGPEKLDELVTIAVEVRKKAYARYSKYAVGAALLSQSGRVFEACNNENATYTLTGHAEDGAVRHAIFEGEALGDPDFIEVMVVCHAQETQSCGICRQVMIEHSGSRKNALVIAVDPEGNPFNVTSLQILLPYAFTPDQLEGE